jgi:hypothetical protein
MKLVYGKDYKYNYVNSRNFIGPSSVTLKLENAVENADGTSIPNIRKNYTVTDKADGDRRLMYISENGRIYMIDTNMNVVGNELTYSNNFINLSGKYNYIIMYLNNLEYTYFNNHLNPAFAKILLNGNPGDILFNTFVPIPDNLYCKSFPISTLSEINVSFVYPDGSPVNFRNINHSFTLKISEEHIENNSINLNSQNIKYYNEYKHVYMNK